MEVATVFYGQAPEGGGPYNVQESLLEGLRRIGPTSAHRFPIYAAGGALLGAPDVIQIPVRRGLRRWLELARRTFQNLLVARPPCTTPGTVVSAIPRRTWSATGVVRVALSRRVRRAVPLHGVGPLHTSRRPGFRRLAPTVNGGDGVVNSTGTTSTSERLWTSSTSSIEYVAAGLDRRRRTVPRIASGGREQEQSERVEEA
jgi:hypothetical protein